MPVSKIQNLKSKVSNSRGIVMPVKTLLLILLAVLTMQVSLRPQDASRVPLFPRAAEERILALANIQPLGSGSVELNGVANVFNQVLWDDLSFSGFFTMAGRSFYPAKPIVRPEIDIDYDAWDALPFKVSFLTVGSMGLVRDGVVRMELSVYDMRQRKQSFGTSYTGNINDTRKIAHMWADEIVYYLTAATSNGISNTRIAYVSKKGDAQEISLMDYDGYNPTQFTNNGSLNLFPNWAPDNSKLAFVSYRPNPEVVIYSTVDGARLPFPMANSLASTPAISPNGTDIAFTRRTAGGNSNIFVSALDGSRLRNLTNTRANETSPTWSPSGRQIAYISGEKAGQVYIRDVDGTNECRILKEGGDSDAVSWSPDGRWLAFHWKPSRSNHYDIFVADAATGVIRQITSGNGSNESPSWAPDSRHLAFQSNRSGSWQIYIMLLDRTDASAIRQITTQGNNKSPAWSGYYK
jgi:TolB protein